MKHLRRILSLLLALCLALCGGAGCAPGGDPAMRGWKMYSVAWFDVFDTVTMVQGYAPSESEWNTQMAALHEDLLRYHRLYDIYNHYDGVTNLYDVNAAAAAGPVEVPAELFDLLRHARAMYELTDGRTAPAMGAVFTLWHDARTAAETDPASAAPPAGDALTAAALHCDMEDLILDEAAQTVRFTDPALRLDVGSIGKGYAVEQAAKTAEARGLASALIGVGGNLRAIGHKPDGRLWTGGVENPWGGEELLGALYLPEGASLVTSGNYQRYFEKDGVRYHHLIDPATLQPAGYFDLVSVLCADSGLADGLSTGLFCMPLEEGQALVDSLEGVEALWALPDGTIVTSAGWDSHSMG